MEWSPETFAKNTCVLFHRFVEYQKRILFLFDDLNLSPLLSLSTPYSPQPSTIDHHSLKLYTVSSSLRSCSVTSTHFNLFIFFDLLYNKIYHCIWTEESNSISRLKQGDGCRGKRNRADPYWNYARDCWGTASGYKLYQLFLPFFFVGVIFWNLSPYWLCLVRNRVRLE